MVALCSVFAKILQAIFFILQADYDYLLFFPLAQFSLLLFSLIIARSRIHPKDTMLRAY